MNTDNAIFTAKEGEQLITLLIKLERHFEDRKMEDYEGIVCNMIQQLNDIGIKY